MFINFLAFLDLILVGREQLSRIDHLSVPSLVLNSVIEILIQLQILQFLAVQLKLLSELGRLDEVVG